MNKFNWSAWFGLAALAVVVIAWAGLGWQDKLPERYRRNFVLNQSQSIGLYWRSAVASVPVAAAGTTGVILKLLLHLSNATHGQMLRGMLHVALWVDFVLMIVSVVLAVTLAITQKPIALIPPPYRDKLP
jgi:hypothetical protein